MLKQSKKLILLALVVCPSIVARAQDSDSTVVKKETDPFIERTNKYLTFRLSAHNDIRGFKVKSSSYTVDLEPNDHTSLKFSTSYRWFSFSASFSPKFIPGNDDDELKGKTKTTSFSMALNFDHWMQNISYARIKGYYAKNTSELIPDWVQGSDPYIQFPELVYRGFSGQTGYKLNKKFSFNALSSQSERQLKSAGTLMPMLSYDYYIIDNRIELTGQNSSQKSNSFEAQISLAYFYTFVISRSFYVSAGVDPGIGLIRTKILTRLPGGNYTDHQTNPVFRIEGACAVGYDAEHFFAGAQAIVSNVTYDQNNASSVVVTEQRFTYQIFLGFRLDAPRTLLNMADKADAKRAAFLGK